MYKYFKRKVKTVDGEKLIDFAPTFYGSELYYSIKIPDIERFRMTKNEEGMWKISAQALPLWVHEIELEFHDLIEDQSYDQITADALLEKGFVLQTHPREYYRLDTPSYTIAIVLSDGEWQHYLKPWDEGAIAVVYTMDDIEKIITNAS